jgi:hypothetical protein
MLVAVALLRMKMPFRAARKYGLPSGCPDIRNSSRFVAGTFSCLLVPTN